MRLLAQLLDRAVEVLPAMARRNAIVFGSAPMVFAGLKPDVAFDLDLFVDDATYRVLAGAGFKQHDDERGLPRMIVADSVEVVSTWPGVTYEAVFASSTPRHRSRGLRVAALEHVLAFKTMSTREKDLKEAAVIRLALQRRR